MNDPVQPAVAVGLTGQSSSDDTSGMKRDREKSNVASCVRSGDLFPKVKVLAGLRIWDLMLRV